MTRGDRQRIVRSFGFSGIEVRAAGDQLHFRGYAAVFDSPSVELFPGFREVIARGAFDRTLASNPRVLMLHNHDTNLVLASTDNGTLHLSVDERGLAVEATWADVSYARDVATLYSNGFLRHMSFAFWPVRMHDEQGPDGEIVSVLEEVDLDGGDVSTVAYPAYPETEGEMRARAVAGTLRLLAGTSARDAISVYRELRDGDGHLSGPCRSLVAAAAAELSALLSDGSGETRDDASGDTAAIIQRERTLTLKRYLS